MYVPRTTGKSRERRTARATKGRTAAYGGRDRRRVNRFLILNVLSSLADGLPSPPSHPQSRPPPHAIHAPSFCPTLSSALRYIIPANAHTHTHTQCVIIRYIIALKGDSWAPRGYRQPSPPVVVAHARAPIGPLPFSDGAAYTPSPPLPSTPKLISARGGRGAPAEEVARPIAVPPLRAPRRGDPVVVYIGGDRAN